ncbi:uncharacterized protein MELLADRAFT_108376 [Melampsora larici-populina 98AG31]|uniref:Uncharacterized protein n=1 Tax=Melampsora larici-populina (strain 98AG31 / pathotype 3-4-7) TaxID=747676 RepID=F4RSW8_MELLP|nr:uncharacterized protein MELLADRAFT_108376 [Melampsora larici-populina 98AG31]EGG04530.1 hypothetical protein MELLADRAFT_108376 [Melampsora larici-populina 98AG31]
MSAQEFANNCNNTDLPPKGTALTTVMSEQNEKEQSSSKTRGGRKAKGKKTEINIEVRQEDSGGRKEDGDRRNDEGGEETNELEEKEDGGNRMEGVEMEDDRLRDGNLREDRQGLGQFEHLINDNQRGLVTGLVFSEIIQHIQKKEKKVIEVMSLSYKAERLIIPRISLRRDKGNLTEVDLKR